MKASEQSEQRAGQHIRKWQKFMERAARELLLERKLSRRVFAPRVEVTMSLWAGFWVYVGKSHFAVKYSELATMSDQELLDHINDFADEVDEVRLTMAQMKE